MLIQPCLLMLLVHYDMNTFTFVEGVFLRERGDGIWIVIGLTGDAEAKPEKIYY